MTRRRTQTYTRSSLEDDEGAITTEYAVVVGVCAIVVSTALAALGPAMVASYKASRLTLIAPVP
jgi:Flp pilus assembly pilin Flp